MPLPHSADVNTYAWVLAGCPGVAMYEGFHGGFPTDRFFDDYELIVASEDE